MENSMFLLCMKKLFVSIYWFCLLFLKIIGNCIMFIDWSVTGFLPRISSRMAKLKVDVNILSSSQKCSIQNVTE